MRNKELLSISYKGCDLIRADFLVRARDFTILDELSAILDAHSEDSSLIFTTAAWNKAERLIIPLLKSKYPHRTEIQTRMSSAHLKA